MTDNFRPTIARPLIIRAVKMCTADEAQALCDSWRLEGLILPSPPRLGIVVCFDCDPDSERVLVPACCLISASGLEDQSVLANASKKKILKDIKGEPAPR